MGFDLFGIRAKRAERRKRIEAYLKEFEEKKNKELSINNESKVIADEEYEKKQKEYCITGYDKYAYELCQMQYGSFTDAIITCMANKYFWVKNLVDMFEYDTNTGLDKVFDAERRVAFILQPCLEEFGINLNNPFVKALNHLATTIPESKLISLCRFEYMFSLYFKNYKECGNLHQYIELYLRLFANYRFWSLSDYEWEIARKKIYQGKPVDLDNLNPVENIDIDFEL